MTTPSSLVLPGELFGDAADRVPEEERVGLLARVDALVAELIHPTGEVNDDELLAWVGHSPSLTFFGVALSMRTYKVKPQPPKQKHLSRDPRFLRLLGFQYLTVRTGDRITRPDWWSGEPWSPAAPERAAVRPKDTGEPYCTCDKTTFFPVDEEAKLWLCGRCGTPVRSWLYGASNYLEDFVVQDGRLAGEKFTAPELAEDDSVLTDYRITADTGTTDLFAFGEPSFILKPYEPKV